MEKLSFVVRIPRHDLTDLALNLDGTEFGGGATPMQLAGFLRDAIIAGLDEYGIDSAGVEIAPVKVNTSAT